MNAKTARRALLILSSPQFGFDRDAGPERENNLRMEPVFIATRYRMGRNGRDVRTDTRPNADNPALRQPRPRPQTLPEARDLPSPLQACSPGDGLDRAPH